MRKKLSTYGCEPWGWCYKWTVWMDGIEKNSMSMDLQLRKIESVSPIDMWSGEPNRVQSS